MDNERGLVTYWKENIRPLIFVRMIQDLYKGDMGKAPSNEVGQYIYDQLVIDIQSSEEYNKGGQYNGETYVSTPSGDKLPPFSSEIRRMITDALSEANEVVIDPIEVYVTMLGLTIRAIMDGLNE